MVAVLGRPPAAMVEQCRPSIRQVLVHISSLDIIHIYLSQSFVLLYVLHILMLCKRICPQATARGPTSSLEHAIGPHPEFVSFIAGHYIYIYIYYHKLYNI